MIELVLAVCSILHGQTCKNVKLTYIADQVTPYSCAMYGQIEISRWQTGHPNWSLKKWTCRPKADVAKA